MNLSKWIVALCCLTSFGAHSEGMTGNELLQKLTDQDSDALFYLVGIVDAAEASRLVFDQNLMGGDEKARKEAIAILGRYWGCRPEKATYGQVRDVTISYLRENPQVRHSESLFLIAAAMRKAWPCTVKSP